MEIRIVEANNLRNAATELKQSGFRLLLVSGVDWVQKSNTYEALYHFSKVCGPDLVLLKVSVPADDPKVPSIADIFGLADWHERETYDLLGITFEGHPNLARIFLPDDLKAIFFEGTD